MESRQGWSTGLGLVAQARASVGCLHCLRGDGDEVDDCRGDVAVDGGRIRLPDGDGRCGCCHRIVRTMGCQAAWPKRSVASRGRAGVMHWGTGNRRGP